jgi:hypothetical protein
MLLNAQVGEGGQAQMLTHGVGGGGQVGNGINQGAIQIEGNGFDVFQVHDLDLVLIRLGPAMPDIEHGLGAETGAEQVVGNLAGRLLRRAQATIALECGKAFVGNCCGSLCGCWPACRYRSHQG